MNRVKQLNRLLPLVAIGTIADCQSVLEPTNRLLVRAGLQILQQSTLISGLDELMDQTRLQEKMAQGYKITSQDLAFTLSPILNSSGRLSHAKLSIATLLSRSPEKVSDHPDFSQTTGKQLATQLIETNVQRKLQVAEILSEVEQSAAEQVNGGSQVIWLEGQWSKGLVGLLASRLVNQLGLPCVVVSQEEDGVASASLRAPEGYHLPNAMLELSDILHKFGGHPGAAGFSTDNELLPRVKQRLVHALSEQGLEIKSAYINSSGNQTVMYDAPQELQDLLRKPHVVQLDSKECTSELLQQVWTLDPFGQDFPMPEFLIKIDNYTLKWIGSQANHVKLNFQQSMQITLFRISPEQKELWLNAPQQPIWVLARVSQNTWQNQTKNELVGDKLWLSNDFKQNHKI